MTQQTLPRYVLAADIGGTTMRAALVDIAGQIIARASSPTAPERGPADAAQRLVALLHATATEDARDGARIVGIGIATAGPIDPVSGTYRYPPNLAGWHGFSLRPDITQAFPFPLSIGHDATLAARAEAHFGAHKDTRHLVYLTVSTGVGAGLFANGISITGSEGGAGEAGHMIVQPGGPSCGVGCSGCLEAVASGTGIAAAAHVAVANGVVTSLTRDAEAPDVFRAAAAGDALATRIVNDAIEGLAVGLTNLLALLDPEVIVLGGGVVRGLAAHWDRLLARTRSMALPRYADGVPVEFSVLGDDASLLGAALIAFDAAL